MLCRQERQITFSLGDSRRDEQISQKEGKNMSSASLDVFNNLSSREKINQILPRLFADTEYNSVPRGQHSTSSC